MNIFQYKTPLFFLVVTLSSLFLSACGDSDDTKIVDSDSISTSQFYATYILIDDGSEQLYTEVQLTKGFAPTGNSADDLYIELVKGDELSISNGPIILDRVDLNDNLFDELEYHSDKHVYLESANDVRFQGYGFLALWGYVIERGTFYSAMYRRPADDSALYNITLSRGKGKDVFPSTVEVPADFDLIAPGNGFQFSRSTDDVELVWDNVASDYAVQITARTQCVSGNFEDITIELASDVGGYTFEAGALDSMVFDGQCSTTLTIAKVRLGSLNSSFIGGIIYGQQVRRLVMRSTD